MSDESKPAIPVVDSGGAIERSLLRRINTTHFLEGGNRHVPEVPRVSDIATQQRAYDLYLNNGLEPDEIALELGMPISEARKLAKAGDWAARRDALREQVRREIEERHLTALRASSQYQDWANTNRFEAAKEHLEASRTIVTLVQAAAASLKEMSTDGKLKKIDTAELRRISEALSSAAAVGARAVGLTDKVAESQSRKEGGRVPLVMVNVAPPSIPGGAVEVKLEER